MKRQNSTGKLPGHLYKFGQYAEQYFYVLYYSQVFILLTYSSKHVLSSIVDPDHMDLQCFQMRYFFVQQDTASSVMIAKKTNLQNQNKT